MKKLKPITIEFDGGTISMIGRYPGNAPYIAITMQGKNGYHGSIPDKEIKRLRKWCDEILKAHS